VSYLAQVGSRLIDVADLPGLAAEIKSLGVRLAQAQLVAILVSRETPQLQGIYNLQVI